MEKENNTVNDIAALALAGSQFVKTDIPFVIVPRGHEVVSLKNQMEKEGQIKQRVSVKTASSLIAYFVRFKDARSVIFADKDNVRFRGVLDYHGDHASPDECSHVVSYDCPLSDDWKAINGNDKQKFDQVDFAEFLEQNINLIAPVSDNYAGPSGAELLSMVLAFQETRESAFKSVQRLSDGTCQFSFSNEKSGSGNTQLPEKISLAVSPFHNGTAYQIDARIRYRLREGRLALWYELIEPKKIIEHAFNEILVDLEAQLPDVPVFEGAI